MFAVVEFQETSEVEVVPIDWLTNDGKLCSWHSISGVGAAQKIAKAVQNKVEPTGQLGEVHHKAHHVQDRYIKILLLILR